MKKTAILLTLLTALVGIGTAQADEISQIVPPSPTTQAQTSFTGTITNIAPTSIPVHQQRQSGGSNLLGTAIGGIAGGLLGHAIGGKKHHTAGTVVGAVGGAYAGSKIAGGGTKEVEAGSVPGVQLAVRKDDGSNVLLSQPVEQGVQFAKGQRIAVEKLAGGWHAARIN